MTKAELKTFLSVETDLGIVEWLLGTRPWIFEDDASFYAWRNLVAASLQVSAESIRIVGSAVTGFSLSPDKPGRPFRETPDLSGARSDIDIAIVSSDLFTEAWDAVVLSDREHRLYGNRPKIRQDVYFGLVARHDIPRNTRPARLIKTALAAGGRTPPLRGYALHCRVYRRLPDLEAYHVQSLRQLRASLN